MTPTTLLEKIIEKAVKNGWRLEDASVGNFNISSSDTVEDVAKNVDAIESFSLSDLLFCSDFLKYYFGEGEVPVDINLATNTLKMVTRWKMYALQLALTPPEERLSYLEKYL